MSHSYLAGVSEQLRLATERHPDRTVLAFPDESISYQHFHELSLQVGKGLASLGVGRGDTVGILALNTINGMAALYGVVRIGAVPVPINNRFKDHELHYIFGHAELAGLITADRESDPTCYAEMANRVWSTGSHCHRIQLGDVHVPGFVGREEFLRLGDSVTLEADTATMGDGAATAILMYTSGTTGRPKGCLLSHACLVTAAYNLIERLDLTETDVMWDVLPFFHLSGVLPLLATIIAGGTMLSMRHFEPRAALDQLEGMRATVALPAFETIWMRVLTQPDFKQRNLSSIGVIQNIGVENRLRHMQELLPHAIQVSNYGMTELGGYATLHRLTDSLETRVSTSGPPLGDMQLRVVDEDGQVLPHGSLGEIVARGGQMFSGYFKDPQATSESIRDGWFQTGDLGTMNELGHVTFVGRQKDMLKVGGENVAAAEIETYLVTHPAIQIAVVVAAEDERYGQVPAAFVQLRAGASLTEQGLIEFCTGKIASYKVPRYVRFVDEWPMSGTKIQKFRLRETINDELRRKGIRSAPRVNTATDPVSATSDPLMTGVTTSTLRGIRVLDLSSLVAGPYCAMSLADWGADVIKIEPLGGEASRHVGPAHPGGLTATALAMNRSKRSIELDFHDPQSIQTILELARESDVLVHNLLPGLMARMGLSEVRLRKANERLVIVHVTAFGQGTDRDRPGLDPVFQAAAGLMSVTGGIGGQPRRVGAPIIDVAAGMLAASAALLGLLQRQLTGIGSTSTISMVEVALALQTASIGNYLFSGEQPTRIGNASHFTLTDSYSTRDGSLVISVISDRVWTDLCDILSAPNLGPSAYPTNDARLEHREHLHEVIESVLRTEDTEHWVRLLHDRRVPYAPVQGYAEAIDYAASQNSDYLVQTSDASSRIVTLANPVRLTGYPGGAPTHTPRVGQHTEEILSALPITEPRSSSGRTSG